LFIDVNSWPRVADGVGYLSCLWLLCAALLLPAADSLAGKRAYGEDFVRVGQRWTDAGPPPALSRETPPPGSDGGFLRQIEQLQDREGPYSDSLAEPLAGLGRYYRSAGDLDGALRSYRRALHVVRINDGLYSERQIPILQELLDTYRGSGDLQALDQRYDYYFRLYGNGQPPYSEVRLRATLGYLRWQREAIRLGMDGERHRRLLALYHMNDTLIQATGQDPAVSRQQHREVVLSQLRNLYLLEDRIAPRLEKIGVAESAPSFGGEWEQGDFDRKRLETLQRGALSRGAGLLRDLIDRSGADTPTEELLKSWRACTWNWGTGTSGMAARARRSSTPGWWRYFPPRGAMNCWSSGWASRWNCRITALSGSRRWRRVRSEGWSLKPVTTSRQRDGSAICRQAWQPRKTTDWPPA
jgi:tetratricopeptide (TPR) repeat protein